MASVSDLSKSKGDCVASTNVNVTNRGFEYVSQWMAGNFGPSASSKFTAPTIIGWGNACGSNATSAVLPATSPGGSITTGQYFDVAPFREFTTEARVGATSAVTNNVVTAGSVTTTFVGTITAGTNHNTSGSNAEGGAVGEAFLAFTTSKHSATTIANAVTSTVSGSCTVASGAALPSGTPFYAQMNNEVILIGTISTNVLTISRAQNGSTANASAVGDGVTCGNIPGALATNPNNGDMFCHAGFTNLALNSGDSIQFTWNISVTS